MDGKKQFIIECIAIIVVVCAVVWVLGRAFLPADVDSAIARVEAFHELDENAYDVIGYGSSHVLNGFDAKLLNDEYGIRAYNYGDLWQQLNTTLLFLKDSLRTQSPKVVIIDTYRVDDVIVDQNMDGEVYYTRAISNFDGREQYLKQCFGDNRMRYISYYFPFAAFHDNWINADFTHVFQLTSSKEKKEFTYGFGELDKSVPQVISEDLFYPQLELPEESVVILDEIVEICDEKEIQLIFCTFPFAEEYKYGDAMTKYAENNGCVYINYFDKMNELGIDPNTDFANEGHLNKNGADKITRDLVGYLCIE